VFTWAIQTWFDTAWHTKVTVWMRAMLCQTVLCWPWKDNCVVQHGTAQHGMAWEDHVWTLIELWPAYTHCILFTWERTMYFWVEMDRVHKQLSKASSLAAVSSRQVSSWELLHAFEKLLVFSWLVSCYAHLTWVYFCTCSTKVCLSILCEVRCLLLSSTSWSNVEILAPPIQLLKDY